MSTTKIKIAANKRSFFNIIERLKMFMDAFIKQLKKTPVKEKPVKEIKPKIKPAPRRVAVKNKTTATRKTKPKTGV